MGELRDATNTISEANKNNIKQVAQAVRSYGQSYTQVVRACQEQALDTTREITDIVCDSQKQIIIIVCDSDHLLSRCSSPILLMWFCCSRVLKVPHYWKPKLRRLSTLQIVLCVLDLFLLWPLTFIPNSFAKSVTEQPSMSRISFIIFHSNSLYFAMSIWAGSNVQLLPVFFLLEL